MTLAADVWSQFGRLRLDEVPPTVRQIATQSLLDWFGCAYAGSDDTCTNIVREEFVGVLGPSTLIGAESTTTSPTAAALVNGIAGHALDYDDSNAFAGFHPSAPVAPAVLALAEEHDRTGADLLTAYIVGVEVGARCNAAIGPDHYAKGWHTTSSLGVLAAAAASAWLLRLDDEQFGCAHGLATSMSSGVRANLGTMSKPFHAGHASERGLLAARLASRGFTANHAAFDGPNGLLATAGTGECDDDALTSISSTWTISSTLFKFRAACHGTHAPIEATLALLDRIRLDDVTRVDITIHPVIGDICAVKYPQTGLQAKFSVRAATAFAMLGLDTSAPDTYCEHNIRRADVDALMRRIDVHHDAATVTPTGAIVRFTTTDGHSETIGTDIGRTDGDLNHQESLLLAKFKANTSGVISTERAQRLADNLLGISSLGSVRQLVE